MNKKYPNLMSPLQIGRFTLKNRIEAAPMGLGYLTPEGYLTEEAIIAHASRAKGGAAIVNIGEARIDKTTGLSHDTTLCLDNPNTLPSLLRCTDTIKRYGALPAVEILHPGGRSNPEFYSGTIWAPSDAPGHLGKPYKEMPEDIINFVVKCFADAAELAAFGGIQLITIHAGHGWLLHEFLSPMNNHRTDKFGGSLENRARITLMVLDAIRERVGNSVLLELRMSGTEFVEGGLTIEDQCEFAKLVDDKVDLINVSTGSFHFPETNQRMDPNMFYPGGCNVKYAAAVKKVVKHAKVVGIGGLDDPDMMEKFIADGWCDMVGIVRGLIADPELPNKIRCGREADITPCQRCNACLSESFVPYVKYSSRIIRCTVNPNFYREDMVESVKPAVEKKRVLVAGGGPAGMQAAITLSDRGHEVILCEKSDALGGQMRYAEHVSFKKEMDKLMHVLIARVESRPIEVRLNTAVTPEYAEAVQADAIVCAIGAETFIPPIPGIEGSNVVMAIGMHDHMEDVGENVVVVGGGTVGCEESVDLAMRGKKVTLIEMKPELCRDAPYLHHEGVLIQMQDKGVKSFVNTPCKEIVPEGVIAVIDGKETLIKADTVVVAAGLKARIDESEALRDSAFDFRRVGDCNEVARLHQALRDGYNAGAFLI